MEKTKEQIHNNMSSVKNRNTDLEKKLCCALRDVGIVSFCQNDRTVFGSPDIVFKSRKIAVFCDGDFWHGRNWESAKNDIKSNKAFWIDKIESNIKRDLEVNERLRKEGWLVLRFWGSQIKTDVMSCVKSIQNALHTIPDSPYRTIDLCAGIGGIRRGFELTEEFTNVLSAEIDKYACETYRHLFGENPYNDLTSEPFKKLVEKTPYDFLMAGFPCQTFSRAGCQDGFNNTEKGQIFFHIAGIIENTRPMGFFLENVDRLMTHDEGNTFRVIAETLVNKLGYHVIGINKNVDGSLSYSQDSIIRNSRFFGVPQNRPRTYLIGFDTERFDKDALARLPLELPSSGNETLYEDLNSLLDVEVPAKYYMASGYLETLIRHRERQENRGYGFGYRIVNEPGIIHPVANTLLATGGSGKERNLIYDPRDGIAGLRIKGKKTPLNNKGIRVMTPSEWGKLQGFVNYAFIDENGNDLFSFPSNITDTQKYKQFGNSVTIPVIFTMASFVLDCLNTLQDNGV